MNSLKILPTLLKLSLNHLTGIVVAFLLLELRLDLYYDIIEWYIV